MKRLFISIMLVGAVAVLTGCCSSGGCGVYYTSTYVPVASTCSTCNVRPVCSNCNTCSTCGYGYGYNDWY